MKNQINFSVEIPHTDYIPDFKVINQSLSDNGINEFYWFEDHSDLQRAIDGGYIEIVRGPIVDKVIFYF